MSAQRRVSGTAVQRTMAVLGSAAFFVVAPCTLAGLVPWSITGWQLQPPFLGLELMRLLGAIMILAGVSGLVDSFARFALQGPGTPAPIAPTRNLVVTGLYRYVRNPIYVALVAIILGQALLMGDWRLIVYGALLWLAFHVQVVHPCCVCRACNAPLAIASTPWGTVTWKRYDALSSGWSLTGNHVAAACGCPATTAPSFVWKKPDGPFRGSAIVFGAPR